MDALTVQKCPWMRFTCSIFIWLCQRAMPVKTHACVQTYAHLVNFLDRVCHCQLANYLSCGYPCLQVYYNNVLSLPLIAVLMWWYGEVHGLLEQPALRNPVFLVAACASSLVAFSISFASLWFLSTTTATSYSLVGSLNKIPVAVIGLVAFNVPWSLENLASIMVGLVAGIVFVKAKSQPVQK